MTSDLVFAWEIGDLLESDLSISKSAYQKDSFGYVYSLNFQFTIVTTFAAKKFRSFNLNQSNTCGFHQLVVS